MKKEDDGVAKRDINIQLLRIIAILMIIGTHLKLPFIVNDSPSKIGIAITCLVSDGVAIFWIITGFNYFNEEDYKKRIKKTIFRIAIPLFICSVVYFYFYRYIAGTHSLIDSVHHTSNEYVDAIKNGLLIMNDNTYGSGHLWFLHVYIILNLIYPVLYIFKNFIAKFKAEVIILSFVLVLALNDWFYNSILQFDNNYKGILAVSFLVITGYLLYKNKEKFKNNKKIGAIGLALFLCANVIRSIVQYNLSYQMPNNAEPLMWYTSYAMVSTIGIVLFVYGLLGNIDKSQKVSKIIDHIGNLTFYIYLIHILVLAFLRSKGIDIAIINLFNNYKFGTLFYEIIFTFIVFAISLVLSEIIRFGVNRLKRLCFKVK